MQIAPSPVAKQRRPVIGGTLRIRRIGLHTQREPVVIMRRDCALCRSEGLGSRSQVLLRADGREVTAILFQGAEQLLERDEIGLSDAAWTLLDGREGELVSVSHVQPLRSMQWVRGRIFGQSIKAAAFDEIIPDVVAGRYSDVQLSAFITAGSSFPFSDDETFALTNAMVEAGERLQWNDKTVVDKHSVGGLPGNRTSPIVVAIVAACGLTIPKTSSRAITSPAGTADSMETVTRVDLGPTLMRKVVEQEGGCLVWGGALNLSPADDIFIGVERQLDVDPEGQLIASVLSKKIAAGATRVVLDIPVGPTAKVRSHESAERLARRLTQIGARFGLVVQCQLSDGTQPVGRSIGPALEMMDVLSVLRMESNAPIDLKERSLALASAVIALGRECTAEEARATAEQTLETGAAYRKFEQICLAQGAFRQPPRAKLQQDVEALTSGRVTSINNRAIAQLAKLAGAPDMPAAGLRLHARIGDWVEKGQPLITLYADTQAELSYPLAYASSTPDIIEFGP
ncbi:MAG TPA: thymidine phosphorylase family protein [Sphingomicrobium sp.]|nr:thymidine phosphorylase family protein [Sphingomicrobium sp.]